MNRINREILFHDQRYGAEVDTRKKLDKYYSINRSVFNRFNQIVKDRCNKKRLLEYGCGSGNDSLHWVNYGAKLTGIDISAEGINKAQIAIPGATFLVMNAEDMTFGENSFDIVVGSGILHHLNLSTSLTELSRVLAPNGSGVFVEPLGHNPLINLYRRLTPAMRTEDEHPLLMKDIDRISQYFKRLDVDYFSLTTMLAVPFRNTPIFESLVRGLSRLDRVIFRVPYLRRFAWIVVLHMQDPIKSSSDLKSVVH